MPYKTDQEKVYKRSLLEEAYSELKQRLDDASKWPSDFNRRRCNVSAVAKDYNINRSSFWHFIQMKTYE
jgi:hypothetical protein